MKLEVRMSAYNVPLMTLGLISKIENNLADRSKDWITTSVPIGFTPYPYDEIVYHNLKNIYKINGFDLSITSYQKIQDISGTSYLYTFKISHLQQNEEVIFKEMDKTDDLPF